MDRDELRKIAELARITLSEEERERFAEELTSILEYFDQLQQVDTSGVSPASHAADLEGPLRADRSHHYARPAELLRESESSEGDFFVVPRIL